MTTDHPSRADATAISIKDGHGGPDLVYDYGTSVKSLPLTDHDLARTLDVLAARQVMTPVMAAHLERHERTKDEIAGHEDNLRNEIRRFKQALAHIESVFRLRLGQDEDS